VDAFYLKDDDYAKGAALSTNLPRRLLKLSTSYQLPGELDKWRIGGGVYRQSRIYEDGSFNGTDFRVEQKAYVIADMMLGYQASKQLSLQLN
ncbi:TonB-dependent receptor, partial [Acinetobacter baumannii]